MLPFVYPGESARLLCQWNGLATDGTSTHPLMGLLARPFGLSNVLAPVLALLAALGVGFLAARVIRRMATGEDAAVDAGLMAWLAGIVSAVLFLCSSATIAAGTHVEPALFGVVAVLVAAHALAGALVVRSALSYLLIPVAGFLFGFFGGECPIVVACAPLAWLATLFACWKRRGVTRLLAAAALLTMGFAFGFLIYVGVFTEGFPTALVMVKHGILGQLMLVEGGGKRAVFALLPFLVAAFILPRAFGDLARTKRVTLGHLALLLLFVAGVSVRFPAADVASAAFVALAFAETLVYFVVTAWAAYRNRPPAGCFFRNMRFISRTLAVGVLAIVGVAMVFRAVMSFDKSYFFADRIADRVLDLLGSRTCLVTDGRLDDHLKIAAARRGKDLTLVNANLDLDAKAKAALAADVTRRLGTRAPELLRSLDLGILPFLEDWVKVDPAATNALAVMAAPDILFSCGVAPVPEVFLFGGDPKAAADWSVWPDLAALLEAPKGWGSANLFRLKTKNPLTFLRLDLRRYLGLVANNRGVWLQEHGDDAGAYKMYALVVDEIDMDNVSALFNLLALADAGVKPAADRKLELQKKMKAIVADETRRYRLWALANYYGTIRNVPALLSLGFAWAKSGRPGEALAQIRRAADLIPSERRSELMNMMAALMADADQREQSQRVYETRLAAKADDRGALMGLVRLELLSGDETKARAYLERAVAAGGDDPRVQTEMALLKMMKGDAAAARDILKSATASAPNDLKAWSLLSAVTMQLSDAAKDSAARAALDRELEEKILPEMKARARGVDAYYVRSAEAFVALRKGEKGRKAAREALIAATQLRPDATVTRELLLGMDISLNDPVAAETHARAALRQDRNSPMANYVMGSLALGKDDLAGAEAYLKKAVAAKKPSAFALNDLAETLRLAGRPAEGEPYARRVVKDFPGLYAGWDTLASIILDRKGDADEALAAAQKAVQLVTKDGRAQDVGVLVTLARTQAAKGDKKLLGMTLGKLEDRQKELNARQRADFESLRR